MSRSSRADYLAAGEVSSTPTCNVVVVIQSRRSGADLIARTRGWRGTRNWRWRVDCIKGVRGRGRRGRWGVELCQMQSYPRPYQCWVRDRIVRRDEVRSGAGQLTVEN